MTGCSCGAPLSLYHNCDSTTIRLRHDYDEKLTCSFFASTSFTIHHYRVPSGPQGPDNVSGQLRPAVFTIYRQYCWLAFREVCIYTAAADSRRPENQKFLAATAAALSRRCISRRRWRHHIPSGGGGRRSARRRVLALRRYTVAFNDNQDTAVLYAFNSVTEFQCKRTFYERPKMNMNSHNHQSRKERRMYRPMVGGKCLGD